MGVQAARRARDDFAYEVRAGTVPDPRRSVTLREVSEEWFKQLDERVDAKDLRPRAAASYKSAARLHVLPVLGSRSVESIGPDDLVVWHTQQRATGASTWTIRARWMAIRGLFNHAARVGYVTHNPADQLLRRERPKPGRARTRYLSHAEIAALLCDREPTPALISALLIFTGVRASEALGLTWADVDFAQERVRVRSQMGRDGVLAPLKTEHGRRDIILMDALAQLLRTHKIATRFSGDANLVICNGVGNTLGYTRLRKTFVAAAGAANILDATPHTCRHTFASILIDQGAPVEFVSQQIGHASTKTTWDIYVHLFRARERADTAKRELDAAFGHMLRASGDPARTDQR